MVGGHHFELAAEVSEPGAEMHLVFKLLEDFCVVEVSVREESVETTHNVVQVLLRVGRDRHSVEVARMHDCRGVVQCVNHIVDGAALGRCLVGSANEDELFVAGHLGARLTRADAEELDDKQVQLEDELADMFVLPHTLVDFSWQVADFHHVGGLVADELLEVLLDGEWSVHLGNVLHAPAPQVTGLGARPVPPADSHLLARWVLLRLRLHFNY